MFDSHAINSGQSLSLGEASALNVATFYTVYQSVWLPPLYLSMFTSPPNKYK